jgi:DNA-binding winged helix-turn-helix (wHTH) protein
VLRGGLGASARSRRIAIHRFGEHRFDSVSGRLERAGRPIELRPRATALLADLIARRARRVTRSELARRVWAGRVVTASSFSTLIAELRKALGDDGRRQAVIRTLGSDGYRFVASVQVEDAHASAREPEGGDLEPITGCVHDRLRPHTETLDVAAHRLADQSLEAALADGPRHLDVAGPHCGAFVHDWACTARDRGLVVHRAQCGDDDAPPLWPWWQISASMLDQIEAAASSGLAGEPPQSLRALWHRIQLEIARGAGSLDAGRSIGDRQRRFVLCHDLSRALLRSARSSPCVVILEGPRCIDADSARLLHFVLSHMDRSPLWILTSAPPPEGMPPRDTARAWPRSDRVRLDDEPGREAGGPGDRPASGR